MCPIVLSSRPYIDSRSAALALAYVLLLSPLAFAQATGGRTIDSFDKLKTDIEERLRKAKEAEATAQRALAQARTALANNARLWPP